MEVAAWRQIPRVELAEMGPALDLALRRHRTPAPDLEKEALKQAKLGKKKVLSCALGLRVFGIMPFSKRSWARRRCNTPNEDDDTAIYAKAFGLWNHEVSMFVLVLPRKRLPPIV